MKFFVLQNPNVEAGDAITDFVAVVGSPVGEAPRCLVCGKFIGMLPLAPPIHVDVEAWGLRWGDVAFGPGDQILISARLKKLFSDGGLVGFSQLARASIAKMRRRSTGAGDPPEYWLASIQHSRTAIDEAASDLVRDEVPECDDCRLGGVIKRIGKVIIRAGTWSGEDVFYARGLPGTILVSERFKRLCDEGGLANCLLVAAEEFSFDHYPHEQSVLPRH